MTDVTKEIQGPENITEPDIDLGDLAPGVSPVKLINRRDFLKLGAALIAGGAVTASVPKSIINPLTNSDFGGTGARVAQATEGIEDQPPLEARKIHGIEVYGLNNEIKTQKDFDKLYAQLNQNFNDELPFFVRSADPWEQRDVHWGVNVRAVEIVVRKSDFTNDPLSDDFTLRMQQQVDLMNRVFENSTPRVNLQVKLARIIVLDDNFAAETPYGPKGHPAGFKYTHDVDFSELINNEPGENQNYWKVYTSPEGKLTVECNQGPGFEEEYYFPPKHDSLENIKEASISYYLFHEWMHRLINVPDEYRMEITKTDTDIFKFWLWDIETGSWKIPHFTPYIGAVANWQFKRGVRGYFSHPQSIQVSEQNETRIWEQRPETIHIQATDATSIEIFATRTPRGYNSARNKEEAVTKTLPDVPDQKIAGNIITMDSKLFQSVLWHEPFTFVDEVPDTKGSDVQIVPTSYVIRAIIDEKSKEVHLPVSAFFLSKIEGNLKEATYTIQFTGDEMIDRNVLCVNFVDQSELDHYTEKLKNDGGVVYATMKVDGTDTVFVWFQKPPKFIPKSTSAPSIVRPNPYLHQTR